MPYILLLSFPYFQHFNHFNSPVIDGLSKELGKIKIVDNGMRGDQEAVRSFEKGPAKTGNDLILLKGGPFSVVFFPL